MSRVGLLEPVSVSGLARKARLLFPTFPHLPVPCLSAPWPVQRITGMDGRGGDEHSKIATILA